MTSFLAKPITKGQVIEVVEQFAEATRDVKASKRHSRKGSRS